ncbi:MAG: hypothetical protein ABL929_11950 [Ferruginibacter sp.]|nr:hypothetical protein [Ferruginibacter sp.]
MKSLIITTFLFILCAETFAQPYVQKTAFDNESILAQVDSLKTEFAKQNFVAVKEASMVMDSEYEIPVIVPLKEGTWYRIIFIGDITSRLYEVRMFDWNEKQVVYQKKMWGDVDGNIINYDYIPRFSEYHMIKPVQINKKKEQIGGYFIIFKKIIKP